MKQLIFTDKVRLGKSWVTSMSAGVSPDRFMAPYLAMCEREGYVNEAMDILTLGFSEYMIDEMYESIMKTYNSHKEFIEKKQSSMYNNLKRICDICGQPEAINNLVPSHVLIGQAYIKAGERLMVSNG